MAQLPPISSYSTEFLAEYRGNTPLAICIVFITLETAFVSLRYWARYLAKVKLGIDDYFMIPGTILCLGQCGLCIAFIKAGGAGFHEATVRKDNPTQVILFHKIQFIIAITYFAAVLLPKLSILGIYVRVFSTRPYRILTSIVASLMIGNWIGTTVAITQICRPLAFFWNHKVPGGGTCFRIADFLRWSSFMNIITDLAMIIIPLPAVWKLQSSRNMKVGLTITFALGGLGLITSIIRFVGFFSNDATVDAQWAAAPLISWTIVETGTYLIAACLPTLKPLAVIIWKKNSITQMRSRVTNPGKKTNDAGGIALDNVDTSGFRRLDDDSTTFIDPHGNYKWVTSSGQPEIRHSLEGVQGIVVHHQVDITSK